MSAVDQALLKIFDDRQQRSTSEAGCHAASSDSAGSTPDSSAGWSDGQTATHPAMTSRDGDRLRADRLETSPATGSPTFGPPSRAAERAGGPAGAISDSAPPQKDLQAAALRAACQTQTAAFDQDLAGVVPTSGTTASAGCTTFRFDAAHQARMPMLHQLRVMGNLTGEDEVAAVEDRVSDTVAGALADPEPEPDPAASPASTAGESVQPTGEGSGSRGAGWRAAFEVDQFRWPPLCESVQRAVGGEIESAAGLVIQQCRDGRNVVAVAGLSGATGCTTFALCLAERLVALSVRVLVVDANFGNPSLAHSLGMQCDFGWNRGGSQPIREFLIESLEDGITVAPWCAPAADALPHDFCSAWSRLISGVRDKFDVVLIDAGPLERLLEDSSRSILQPATVDRVIFVQSEGDEPDKQLAGPVRRCLAVGVVPLGVVCNAHAVTTSAQD
ncbi:MAG: hypothetical protein GTO53_08155 [Planctomycetales bacterium]|nr:hypothetical protein [Planctomycetales bacterium]NIM09105.1 hypothetical protein [Planctomycetales bacterium]NIN08576.1 hypothetical protein [Planctomycetales bacterium]NIN77698.1 hypothetical protein [Planctomycetales bacterium]NIO34874.1 hypothetical protein [Planctomycetales bacterium]